MLIISILFLIFIIIIPIITVFFFRGSSNKNLAIYLIDSCQLSAYILKVPYRKKRLFRRLWLFLHYSIFIFFSFFLMLNDMSEFNTMYGIVYEDFKWW